MKKITLAILAFLALSNYAQSQTLVAMPKGELDTALPIPAVIEILDPDRSNFELTIKAGGREVNKIQVSGNININKLGTRFLGVDPNIGHHNLEKQEASRRKNNSPIEITSNRANRCCRRKSTNRG